MRKTWDKTDEKFLQALCMYRDICLDECYNCNEFCIVNPVSPNNETKKAFELYTKRCFDALAKRAIKESIYNPKHNIEA